MKKITLLLICAIAILFAFRFVASTLEEVGTTIEEVKIQTVNQLARDHFSTYYTTQIKDACKKLSPGVREATLLSIGKIIRDYVESPEFKTDFQKYLEESYPIHPFDADEARWEPRRKQKVDELNAFVNNPNPALVEMTVKTLDIDIQSKQSILKMADNPALKSMMAQMGSPEEMNQDIKDDEMLSGLYKSDLASFKKKYPEIMAARQIRDEKKAERNSAENSATKANDERAKRSDYKATLKTQLQEFLDGSASIDFNATTKADAQGIKKFVNPDYEAKDGNWKFYYRCGKEAVGGARKYAQSWLTAIR